MFEAGRVIPRIIADRYEEWRMPKPMEEVRTHGEIKIAAILHEYYRMLRDASTQQERASIAKKLDETIRKITTNKKNETFEGDKLRLGRSLYIEAVCGLVKISQGSELPSELVGQIRLAALEQFKHGLNNSEGEEPSLPWRYSIQATILNSMPKPTLNRARLEQELRRFAQDPYTRQEPFTVMK